MDYIELKATISPIEIGRDILIAQLAEVGFDSFVETDEGIEAYIKAIDFNEEKIQTINILQKEEFRIQYKTQLIKDQNWNEIWEKNFEPIYVEDKCCVRAPFHEKTNNIEFDIIIEPKMSFGTGHHETTHLMIKKLMELDVAEKDVLDMGCGTGVLAILCKMKKASNILAIDVDEWAYNNTLENVERNNCSDIKVQLGDAKLLNNQKFDLVIANINRNILLQDMGKYNKVLNSKGNLLLSGFFSSDKEIILEASTKLQLQLIAEDVKNDWMMLHLQKV